MIDQNVVSCPSPLTSLICSLQMSWKPLKLSLPSRTARSTSPQKPSTLTPLRTTHDVRTAYLRRQDTVVTPTGVFTFERGRQMPHSILPTGSSRQTSSDIPDPPSSRHHSSSLPPLPASEPGWSSAFSDPHALPDDTTVLKVSKGKKQWVKWSTEVIPSLLQPYLRLLRVTDSLRNLHHNEELECTCGHTQLRKLTVTCLFFDGELLLIPCFHFLIQIVSTEGAIHLDLPMLYCSPSTSCPWLFCLFACCTESCSRYQAPGVCPFAILASCT